MSKHDNPRDSIKHYYGEVLKKSKDLKTSACCCAESPPEEIKAILKQIHPEIISRFYGCGAPFPPALTGRTVLDLGCGTGRDVFVLSALVGEQGHVIGIDMTPEQIALAKAQQMYHAHQFGYAASNVSLIDGYIEDLSAIEDETIDLVISNCVINLSPRKDLVFKEIFRVLKPGGELYFSDVFADRRIPTEFMQDEVLLGECLSGALYEEDFRRILAMLNCLDYRVMSRSPIALHDPEIIARLGNINFSSLCIRAFKLSLEDLCEDYGQVAYYKGTIPNQPHAFILDDHHIFYSGRPVLVCGNTADMLTQTHYRTHFTVLGDKRVHYGKFGGCGQNLAPAAAAGGGCC